jgi:ArsR family transcriptional regulator
MARHERSPGVTRPIYQVKADFFKTLGHPARIRVLELLRDGERSVSEMIPLVGLEQSHLSQQLAVLRRGGIVQSRKNGTTVLYSVTDPRLFHLLETTKEILATYLAESRDLLKDLEGLSFEALAGGLEPVSSPSDVQPPETPRKEPDATADHQDRDR